MPVIYDAAMGRQWLEQPFGNRRMDLDLVLQPLPSPNGSSRGFDARQSPENDSAAPLTNQGPSGAIAGYGELALRMN